MDMAVKDSSEAVTYTFAFANELATGETLTGSATITQRENGSVSTSLTIGSPTVTTPNVTALVSGGTRGHIYVLECSCGTTAGQTLIVEGGLAVK